MRPVSQRLFRQACRILPGGVNSPVRAFKSVGGAPVFMREGRGSKIRDVDGNAYIDYCMSWGPLILGHAYPRVRAAVTRALTKGLSFGAATEGEVRLAGMIRQAFPSMELLRLTSSGTEAVMSALRLARAYTGRELVVKFAGCYHGHVDSLLVAAGSGAMTLGRPDSAGVPASCGRSTIVLPYNDLQAANRAFQKWGPRIAALIVEPVVGNMGVVSPDPGFLRGLGELTRRNKALLIFDEVITGFRLCYGGAQTLWNIRPDLTTLGKIVGGGLPIGAYGGRRQIMELVAPSGPVYQAGTLSGNPIAVAAGMATLETLKDSKPYAALAGRTRELAQALRAEARSAGVPVQVQETASMFTVFFSHAPVSDYATAKAADTKAYARFFHAMLGRGVYLPPAQFEAAFLSTAHTDQDIERTAAAARFALRRAVSGTR